MAAPGVQAPPSRGVKAVITVLALAALTLLIYGVFALIGGFIILLPWIRDAAAKPSLDLYYKGSATILGGLVALVVVVAIGCIMWVVDKLGS
jgi:hypothetical protein